MKQSLREMERLKSWLKPLRLRERRGLKEDMANKGEKKDASFHLFSEGRHGQDLVKRKEQKWRNGCGNYSKVVKMQLVVHVMDSISLVLLRFPKWEGWQNRRREFCYGGSQLGCGISSRNALQYRHRKRGSRCWDWARPEAGRVTPAMGAREKRWSGIKIINNRILRGREEMKS